jgi:two-component system alkaline phosphatase synthesis response regulator PhoP
MLRVYAVEDDEGIREVILYALQSAGFDATGFESGEEFFPVVSKTPPNLILLDIMLPGEDGLSILKKLRGTPQTKSLPVIMLTAKGGEMDKVKALDMGADDYIPKPFGVMELISRVNAVLRRTMPEPQAEEELTIGILKLDNARREVYVAGERADLTFKEFELLLYLAQNAEMALSRDKIIRAVWNHDFEGESRTLDMHIHSLRQKIGSAGKYVKTVRNFGYKFGVRF